MTAHASNLEGKVGNARGWIAIRRSNELEKPPLILVVEFFENRPKISKILQKVRYMGVNDMLPRGKHEKKIEKKRSMLT
jgi:hypothetical protein